MKPLLTPLAAVALTASLSFFSPESALAEADANAQITFTGLTISLASGTLQVPSSATPSWYSQTLVNGQPVTGSSMVNASSYCTIGNVSVSNPYTLNFFGTANSAVDIPGQIPANAQGTGQANANGTFEITGGTGTVNVNFQVAFNGSLSDFTDNYGQSAFSQTTLSLQVGGNTVLSDARSFNIATSQSANQPFNTTIQNTVTLNFNQEYSYELSDGALTMAVNAPEPTTGMLLLGGLALLGIWRVKRR